MGNRLSKIYTRTGDDGSTGLGDGSRTGKDSARVGAYGTVDEANSTLGLVLAAGHLAGAFLGVHLTVLKGHRWVQRVVTVAVIAFAVKLWLES